MDVFAFLWTAFGWMICSASIAAIVFGIKDDKTALCVFGIIGLIVGIILYVISIRHLKQVEAEEREQKERTREERIRKEQKEKEERERRILASPVRNLDPLQFEEFTALYIKKRGYYQIDLTPVSGDFGADIIAYNPQGKKVCIQCKKYSSPVGVSAVQEILSAKLYYQCEIAMVTVTSAGFTRQAKELAKKTGVLLYTFDDVLHEFVSEDKQVLSSAQQGHGTMSTRSTSASLEKGYADNTVSGTNNQSNLQSEAKKPEIQNAPITSSVTQKGNKDVTNTSNKNDTTRTKQNKTDIQWKDRSIGIKQGFALLIQPRIACNSYLTVCVQLDGTVAATEHRSSKAIPALSKWTNILTVGAEGSKIIGLRSNGYVISVDAESGERHCNGSPVACISKHGMSIGESEIAVADGNMFHAVLKKDGTVITKLKIDKYHYAYDAFIADYEAHVFDKKPDSSTWKNIVAMDAGWGHLVGLKADGTVVASGENDCGQCNVSNWSNIIAIATGNSHTVGITAQGDVLAVGSNRGGQCNVAEWVDIVSIVAMGNNTLGIKADGTVVGTGEDVGYGCRYNWRLFNNIDTLIEELKSSLQQIQQNEQKQALLGPTQKEIELKKLEQQYEEVGKQRREVNAKRAQIKGPFQKTKQKELWEEMDKYSSILSDLSGQINRLRTDINHNWDING